ncbi:MAG: hypothetical protein JPMHGGIA_01850 [Saprospiraceae bacterium]|jgi:hypothetical protein|nr:hypothetical protein [Saprospiraceae bacterium]
MPFSDGAILNARLEMVSLNELAGCPSLLRQWLTRIR